jgi:hypothetical protein
LCYDGINSLGNLILSYEFWIPEAGGTPMDDKEKVTNKRIRITIIIIFLVCTVIIAAFFFDCIRDYSEYRENNLNLTREKLTFEKYERRHNRGGWYFDLYVKEYEKPFRIDTITSKGLDKAKLSSLADGDLLHIAFSQNFGEICEISGKNLMILSASDYVKANRNNEVIGMVFLPFVFLCILFLAWVFNRAIEPNNDNEGLGKIRIEYAVKGNVIRIYDSIHVCSLVINDQIFDQHYGVYGSNFCLKGTIGTMKAGERPIRVEAKMGFFHMRLYCNGQLVAKKFMAFG